MNGNVTKEGISRDFEALAEAGFGGVQIFDVGCDIPPGEVKFGSPEWFDILRHAHREAKRLGLMLGIHNCSGWSSSGGPWVTPADAMKVTMHAETAVTGPVRFSKHLPRIKKDNGFYADIAVLAYPTPEGKATLSNANVKTGRSRKGMSLELSSLARDTKEFPSAQTIAKDKIIDLTARMSKDGTLTWDVPAGKWTIFRLGYICNGRRNRLPSKDGDGLEVDKFSAAAFDRHFDAYMGRLCRELGVRAGDDHTTGLSNIHVDSWEVGCQNWTQDLEKIFEKRVGYSIVPYLPILAGHVVGSVEESERFCEDFRRLLADLLSENYAGQFAKRCHELGLRMSAEPYGPSNADDFQYGEHVDIPMSCFWVDGTCGPGKFPCMDNSHYAASLAHVWGRRYAAAEAFTAGPPNGGRWLETPFSIKWQNDRAFAGGCNLIVYHRFTHQPWTDDKRLPGMTMGRWGMHLDRTQTWWNFAGGWFRYQARCQWMLQEGRFVADALFCGGEEVPKHGWPKIDLPKGYGFDACGTGALEHLRVRDGKVVAPGGVEYEMLVLSGSDTMSEKTVRRVGELAAQGARVVAPRRPVRTAGLTERGGNYKAVVDAAWARGITDCSPTEVLNRLGRAPDFQSEMEAAVWIHRRSESADWYFVACGNATNVSFEASFRQVGRVPEIWNAETGEVGDAAEWRVEDGRTVVRLNFPPSGSAFVVFRSAARKSGKPGMSGKPRMSGNSGVSGPWQVSFPVDWYTGGNDVKSFTWATLKDWTTDTDPDVKYFSGTATYRVACSLPRVSPEVRVILDLGAVKDFAEVTVNGKTYPPLWRPPFRVDITDAVRDTGVKVDLEVKVANLWPNRLIGDDILYPEDCKWRLCWHSWQKLNEPGIAEIPQWVKDGKPSPTGRHTFTTWKHWTKKDKLIASGLLGPVSIDIALPPVAPASCGEALVWDATQSGRLMTATNDTVLYTGANLAEMRPARCWFNKARRRRADGTWTMCNGEGRICHVRRAEDGASLVMQCQIFDAGWTKCVKLQLRQSGDDVAGRIVYAKYCTEKNADRVGVDFDTYQQAAPQKIYSVMPSGRTTNGYNVDWLVLREIGSAEDNIPDASNGAMPEDKVMDWMENAADPAAWAKWRMAHPAPFILFGEDRQYAVRNNIVPAHWIAKGSRAAERFHGVAQPGEFYPFQACVFSEKARKLRWNAKTDVKVSRITPAECEVAANGVKPIWVMVDVPKDAAGKTLRGEVRVEDVEDAASALLPFEIEVKGAALEDGGISDAWRLARLKWLNSDIGREETVTKPYEPVVVDEGRRTVKILGRELVLGEDGLPAQIVSHFNGSNARIVEKGLKLLSAPVRFTIEGMGTAGVQQQVKFTEMSPAHASWKAVTDLGGGAKRIVEGRIDFAGECRFRMRIEGAKVGKAAFEMRMPADVARYMDGLGKKGGDFDDGKVEQKWDEKFNRDAVWVGRVNGGVAVRFKGANYRRPLINAYYAWQRLRMPESWASGGGTISVEKGADGAVVRAEASDAPEGAEWNFDLYITPFHQLDMKTHLGDRYCHLSQRRRDFDVATIAAKGATVVNLHHNTVWNPYINYPYNDDSGPLLKKAVKSAHDAGLKLKVYYTTRELTQNLPEFFALKSLDGEALLKRDESVPGWPCTNRNGPHPWLREHVGMDILPAWRENVRFADFYKPRLDLAVITTPDTRWDNFYLEGLDYLVREYGIDGLYIDDTALTGESMQRARRILDRDGTRRLVDNHSWNHHDPRAGSGSTNIAFIDLYPYFDLLWRGEGFSNNTPPDFWLIERSGVAFGIAGEMLGRGNPFRGLLFGMTDRWGWGGNPPGLWKFFDEVKLGDMELVGWWDDDCPVKVSGSPDVKASVWKGDGRAVLVVANFSKEPRTVTLILDSARFGFDPSKVLWQQPSINGVQDDAPASDISKPVEIPGSGGFIFVCDGEACQ